MTASTVGPSLGPGDHVGGVAGGVRRGWLGRVGLRYSAGQVIRVPTAHGEGNCIADAETIARLEGEGRVIFRYCAPSGARDAKFNFTGLFAGLVGYFQRAA